MKLRGVFLRTDVHGLRKITPNEL